MGYKLTCFQSALLLIVLWQFFGESPTNTNLSSDRYDYPALLLQQRQSSLIQSFKFSERPGIVPPGVCMPLRWWTGSLAEDGKTV